MRRAFTLIELMVVCTVLVMLTGLILPNVVAMKKARDRQEAYDAALRLVQRGREAAITSGKVYTLTFTDSGSTISLQPDTDTTTMSRDGNGGSGTLSTMQSANSQNKSTTSDPTKDETGTASFPDGVSTGQMVLDGKSSSAGDFTLHFYPDGHSEDGGFELVDGSSTRNVSVTTDGIATMTDGALPATTTSSWEAGQYAQRTTS